MDSLLSCPHCQAPLVLGAHAYRCAAGHAFDVAREGYVNLLGKGDLGDTREMLQARRAFFGRGHYAPLFAALAAAAADAVERCVETAPVVLDVGCGEGHTLAVIGAALQTRGRAAQLAGFDVSREAARLAAKANPAACVFTADVWKRIYVPGASVHVLLNVFAPRNWSEFARVVAPGGVALIVIPLAHHLAEARRRLGLLEIGAGKADDIAERSREHFDRLGESSIETTLTLDAAAVAELARMTPNYWHLTPAQTAAIAEIKELTTQAAFALLTLCRR